MIDPCAGRSRVVLVGIAPYDSVESGSEEFERMRAAKPDPRKAYRTEETPPELAEFLGTALDRIIRGDPDENDS